MNQSIQLAAHDVRNIFCRELQRLFDDIWRKVSELIPPVERQNITTRLEDHSDGLKIVLYIYSGKYFVAAFASETKFDYN